MRATTLLFALLCAVSSFAQEPEFGWVPAHEASSFILDAGHARLFQSPPEPGTYMLHVESTAGATFGFADAGIMQVMLQNGRLQAEAMACFGYKELSVSRECGTLPPNTPFIIQDARSMARIVLDTAAAVTMRSRNAANDALAENRVTIQLFKWACIRNCS